MTGSRPEWMAITKGDNPMDNNPARAGLQSAKAFTRAFGPAIAADYARLVHNPANRAVYLAYRQFKIELAEQWAGLPVTVTFTDNPAGYASSAEMFADVDAGRLSVFSGGQLPACHPLNEEHTQAGCYNVMFRAVHDFYGHYAGRHSFGPIGEELAFRAHARMFSALAVQALATETRGQNSWVNFGPFAHLPASLRPFAEQKAGLLPAYTWEVL